MLAVILLWALAGPGAKLLWAQQPQSGITSPAPGSVVSGSVPILGTAAGEPFARYELYFKQEPSGDESYIWFAGDTRQVINGQLGVWHTAGLPPGTYTLRLRVVRPDGNYGEFFAPNILVNTGPSPTPTPDEPTPTPIPVATPTPIPQPTPVVVEVEQPQIEEPPTPTPTPEPLAFGPQGPGDEPQAVAPAGQANPLAEELGAVVGLSRLREAFFRGVRWSALIFLLGGGILGLRRLLDFLWTRME